MEADNLYSKINPSAFVEFKIILGIVFYSIKNFSIDGKPPAHV